MLERHRSERKPGLPEQRTRYRDVLDTVQARRDADAARKRGLRFHGGAHGRSLSEDTLARANRSNSTNRATRPTTNSDTAA